MTAIQRHAVFSLIVIGISVVLFALGLVGGLATKASGMLGLLGFLGFAPLFYRKRPSGAVVVDERDGAIILRANAIAFSVLWLGLVAAGMTTYFVRGDAGTVPVRALPVAIYLAWALYESVRSITVLARTRSEDFT